MSGDFDESDTDPGKRLVNIEVSSYRDRIINLETAQAQLATLVRDLCVRVEELQTEINVLKLRR